MVNGASILPLFIYPSQCWPCFVLQLPVLYAILMFAQKRSYESVMSAILVLMVVVVSFAVHQVCYLPSKWPVYWPYTWQPRYLRRVLLCRVYTTREGSRRVSQDCQSWRESNRFVLRTAPTRSVFVFHISFGLHVADIGDHMQVSRRASALTAVCTQGIC